MNTLHKDIYEAIADISRLSTDLVVMESIQLDFFLQTARKRTMFIRKGDLVRVRKDYMAAPMLVDCTDHLGPTHLITECRGTIYSGDLQVDCEDLDTHEIITVKL